MYSCIRVFAYLCFCICWLKLDVGGSSGVRVLALMDTIPSVFVFVYLCICVLGFCICWLKLDVGGSGVRVLALMDTVPSVKLETFGQWGARVNTAKYTNLCRTRLDLVAPFINCGNSSSQQCGSESQ